MAVIISNGNTNLSTASGFYRVEAHNLSSFSTTVLTLSSTARTIDVTFANAGNCQGILLALLPAGSTSGASVYPDLTVTLQENVAGSWTDRATVTKTGTEIYNNADNASNSITYMPFTGGTFPYAVDTVASKWRFAITQSTGSSHQLRTSNGTAPFYATWCDNAVSFTNGDTVICKDIVTIDQSATFSGTLGTGDSANAVCGIVCKSATAPTTSNTEGNFQWATSPAGAYTLTIDGLLCVGAWSGIRVGSSSSPIPYAQRATIYFENRSVGTTASGIYHGNSVSSAIARKASFFFYGEVTTEPVVCDLAAGVSVGGTTFTTTTDISSWSGARVGIGKRSARGVGSTQIHTITGVSGPSGGVYTATITPALATSAALTGAKVINIDAPHGIKIASNTTNRGTIYNMFASNLIVTGVTMDEANFNSSGGAGLADDNAANTAAYLVEDCVYYSTASGVNKTMFVSIAPGIGGGTFNRIYSAHGVGVGIVRASSTGGPVSVTNNIVICSSGINPQINTIISNFTFSNNIFQNHANDYRIRGIAPTFSNNSFWGSSQTTGALSIENTIGYTNMSNNTFNNCTAALGIGSTTSVGVLGQDWIFGNESANTTDVTFTTGGFFDVELASPTGNLTIDTTSLANTTVGSQFRITDYNDTANDDRQYLTYGEFQKTGSGLSDTTVRTSGSGKYALRLKPSSSTDLLQWPVSVSKRTIPTGNIQNLTMTVSVWVYINNAAYYAGTHTKPTLKVKYDNATTVSAVATATAGSWQQLAVSFTPATTFSQIETWIEGKTDASGTNAYFYLDDMSINYPAGASISLGGLDLWANAEPVWPPIATNPSITSVWDEPLSAHTVSGSYGVLLKKVLTVAKFLGLK